MSQQSPTPSWLRRQPTLLPGRALPPELLYRVRSVAWGYFMWTTFALYALYVVRDAGLNPFQLLVVGIVLEFSVFIFEIPTGVIADVVSRRLSIVVGTAIVGVGWIVMGLFPSFEGILAGQFLWGFGYTFLSGATPAWLADEIGEDAAALAYPRAAQWQQGARVAGVLTGSALGLVNPSLPFVVGGIGSLTVTVLLLTTMTERGWQPAPRGERTGMRAIRDILAEAGTVARRRPMVRAAILVALLFGGSSEAFDRLWGYRLIEDISIPFTFDEAILFGAIAIVSQLGGMVVIALGRRMTADGTRASAARLLSFLYTAAVVIPLAFAVVPSAGLAIALITMHQWTTATESPFFAMWVNRGLDSRTRATVLSGVEQANSLGQVLSGMLFAVIAATGGVSVALVVGALIVAPAALLVRTRPTEKPQ